MLLGKIPGFGTKSMFDQEGSRMMKKELETSKMQNIASNKKKKIMNLGPNRKTIASYD